MQDDLRPQLMEAYNHSWMKTPNIDRFSETALVFLRAYVQQQVCSPSRNSFMTVSQPLGPLRTTRETEHECGQGRRPDRTRVWNFIDDFRIKRRANRTSVGVGEWVASPHPAKGGETDAPGAGAHWTTLPQYFKANGYQVYGSGKTFHPNRPMNNDLPLSWTSYDNGQPQRLFRLTNAVRTPSSNQHLLTTGEDLADMRCNNGKPLFAPTVDTSTGEGSAWKRIIGCEMNDPEALLTNATLRYLSTLSPSRPFFIAMGHHKPHLPWYTPNRFFEQYGDPSQYPVAKVQEYPATADKINWHPWFDQLRISDVEPRRKQQFMRRGYYASVSYYDYHFGQVLDKLEEIGKAAETVVLATGDHGWHLGERNMWEKKGLDELDCRVPLMIRVPGLQTASRGQRTSAFAEHVDIMPTLIEFAGLPPCTEDLSGQTLGPVIRNPPVTGTGVGKAHTFSQFPRCNCSYVSRHDIATPGGVH